MSNEAIVTDKAPAALGPYSAAVKSGNVIHVSGQLPVDPATGEFAGEDIASQTRQSLTNIQNILAAAGATMANVAECTVLLDDINDFAGMNEVYGEFFSEPFPARAAFEVAALPKAAKVEIKAVAYLEGASRCISERLAPSRLRAAAALFRAARLSAHFLPAKRALSDGFARRRARLCLYLHALSRAASRDHVERSAPPRRAPSPPPKTAPRLA